MSTVVPDAGGVVVISQMRPQHNQGNGLEEGENCDAPASMPKPIVRFYSGEPEVLGTTQIFTGIVLISFDIMMMIVGSVFGALFYTGVPIWAGILFIISGSLSVAASVKPTVGKIDYISVIKMHFGTNLPAGRFGGRTAHAPAILQDGGAKGEDGRTDIGTPGIPVPKAPATLEEITSSDEGGVIPEPDDESSSDFEDDTRPKLFSQVEMNDLVTSSLVMHIITSLAAAGGIVISSIEFILVSQRNSSVLYWTYCAYYKSDTECLGAFYGLDVYYGFLSLNMTLFMLMFCISISTSVFACKTVCRSSFQEISVVIYQTTSSAVSDTSRDVPPDSTAAISSASMTQTRSSWPM
ncbi:unnamed protein product [Ranitomeya imitator]|uniref:Transmembrane protein n=1 Tax=Ranitomeya imitator TaxID=111125 RepID=A0ABN9L7U3_9NEOB|nr:unnamed protein product [Ranitomeya imitator]